MADVLIGARVTHPSLKLRAGQVRDFAAPPPTALCPICGRAYNNVTFHPNYVA